MNWVFLLISTSLSCHSARRACPELQNPHFQKVKQNHLLGVWFPSERLRVLAKVLFPGTHPQSATILPLPEGEGNLMDDGFCDFAFGSAQNDRGGKFTAKSESSRNWETNHIENLNITNQKGIWCYVYRILMMLGTSFFDWFMCWLFNKSGSYLGVCSSTL